MKFDHISYGGAMLDSVTVLCGEAWARLVRSEMKMNENNGWLQEAMNHCLDVLPDYFDVWPEPCVRFESN